MDKERKRIILKKIAKRIDSKEHEDAEDILYKNRHIFLYSDIDSDIAKEVCSKIISLDMKEDAPITLWLHSDGGCVHSALAIIASMKQAKSTVITVINNVVCSASAIISICGDKRLAFPHSTWMQHSTSESLEDYVQFIKDRMRFGDRIEKIIDKIHTDHTKLTARDIEKYQRGELWLLGKQLIQKGIVDEILEE